MRKIPAHDLSRAAVDRHTRYAQPTAGPAQIFTASVCQIWIRLGCFHAAPLFFRRARRRRERTSNPRALASPATHACDSRAALSFAAATTPPVDSHTPTSLRTPLRSALHRRFGQLGCLVAASGSTDSGPADGQRRRHQRCRVALRQHLAPGSEPHRSSLPHDVF